MNAAYLVFSAKIPFPLTQRFRAMLQNGIDLSTVDVSYVSSRSWYSRYSWQQVYTITCIQLVLIDSRLLLMYIFVTIFFGRYFLNLFGLRGLFSLILGEDNGQYS